MKSNYYCPFCSTMLERDARDNAFIGECGECGEKFYILALSHIDLTHMDAMNKLRNIK